MKLNERASLGLERHLPQARENPYHAYRELVGELLRKRDGIVVVDVGGGRESTVAQLRPAGSTTRLIAVDISAEELALNDAVDEKRVADVVQGLPFDSGEVDAIVSSSVLEHLENLEAFVAHSARVLKPGGYWIHVFSSKFAPYSIANQLLPEHLAHRILLALKPGTEGKCGFRAYYDRCYYSAARRLLRRHGFDEVEVRVSYYQSWYVTSFLPAYLLSSFYELVVRAFKARNLGAYVVVVARKR